jgi:hypothetical protein
MNYPATIEVRTPDQIDNWRPLVQWVLAIPHLLIAGALAYVSSAVGVISWFIILITGHLPADLANLQMMILRYSTRASTYSGFLHDSYPPFDFTMTATEPGGTPVDIGFTPALENRDRLTVALRIFWMIPAILFAFVVSIVGAVCWFIAWFAVLFTGRWPEELRSWAMKMIRVSIRVQAYSLLLTDEYPPFSTD